MGFSIDIGAGNNNPVPTLQPAAGVAAAGTANSQRTSEQGSADTVGDVVTSGTQDGLTLTYDSVQRNVDAVNTDKGSVAVATHEALGDPHPVYETAIEVNTKITIHSGATDPHGDRAFATGEIIAHNINTAAHAAAQFQHWFQPVEEYVPLGIPTYRFASYNEMEVAASETLDAAVGHATVMLPVPGSSTCTEGFGFYVDTNSVDPLYDYAYGYFANMTPGSPDTRWNFYAAGLAENWFGGKTTFGRTIVAPASATGYASLNLPHGTAPTSPVNGDVWTTAAGIYVRINGATVGPLGTGGGGGGGLVLGKGTSIIDFGANGAPMATLVVTGQAAIAAGSLVHCWIKPEATTDHSVGEHIVEDIKVVAADIVAGVGFTIYALSPGTPLAPQPDPLALLGRSSGAGQFAGRGRPDWSNVTQVAGRMNLLKGKWSVGWMFTS